jgi:anti-sigma B factor antagonist
VSGWRGDAGFVTLPGQPDERLARLRDDGALVGRSLDSSTDTIRGGPMPAFRVLGPLDVTTAAAVRAALTDLLAAETTDDLVVDLVGMGPFDTVGLGLLVGIHRQAQRRGRRLVLTGVQPRVMRVLAITKLRRVLTIDQLLSLPADRFAADLVTADRVAADRRVTIDDELRVADGTIPDDHGVIVLPDPAVCAG